MSCEADAGVCTNVVALPVDVAANGEWGLQQTLMLSAVIFFPGLVILPPLMGSALKRRGSQR